MIAWSADEATIAYQMPVSLPVAIHENSPRNGMATPQTLLMPDK